MTLEEEIEVVAMAMWNAYINTMEVLLDIILLDTMGHLVIDKLLPYWQEWEAIAIHAWVRDCPFANMWCPLTVRLPNQLELIL